MTRVQSLKSGSIVQVVNAGTPVPLSGTTLFVKSVTIQALSANTGFVYVGDSSAQLQVIEPRRSMVLWGDNLDNGTTAKINLADIYIDADVNNEGVTFTYLEGM